MRTTYSVFDFLGELESYETDEASPVQKLQQAQAALRLCIGLAEEVAREHDDGHARAYLVDQLKVHASEDHGFLSRAFNFDQWIAQLERGEEEEAEE